jgi:hypothetical protein
MILVLYAHWSKIPDGGRGAGPVEAHPCDPICWQTVVTASETGRLRRQLRAKDYAATDSIAQSIDGRSPLSSACFLTRDPDGHFIRVMESSNGRIAS